MPDDGNGQRRDGSSTGDRSGGQPRQGQPQEQPGRGQQRRGQGGQQPRQQQGQQPRQQRGHQGRPGAGQPGHPAGGSHGGGSGIDFGGLPWVSGAVHGAAYFVTAFIATALVLLVDVVMIANEFGGGGPTGPGGGSGSGELLAYLLGWVFYGAHFVSVSLGSFGSGNIVDVLGAAGLPSLVYYALPPIFLFLAGRSVARSNGHASMENGQLAAYGATVVAGYLPLALVGNYAFTRQGIGPDMGTTLLVMGIVYPIVFGALGGYLADR